MTIVVYKNDLFLKAFLLEVLIYIIEDRYVNGTGSERAVTTHGDQRTVPTYGFGHFGIAPIDILHLGLAIVKDGIGEGGLVSLGLDNPLDIAVEVLRHIRIVTADDYPKVGVQSKQKRGEHP